MSRLHDLADVADDDLSIENKFMREKTRAQRRKRRARCPRRRGG